MVKRDRVRAYEVSKASHCLPSKWFRTAIKAALSTVLAPVQLRPMATRRGKKLHRRVDGVVDETSSVRDSSWPSLRVGASVSQPKAVKA
jgi:hypothetical protein